MSMVDGVSFLIYVALVILIGYRFGRSSTDEPDSF